MEKNLNIFPQIPCRPVPFICQIQSCSLSCLSVETCLCLFVRTCFLLPPTANILPVFHLYSAYHSHLTGLLVDSCGKDLVLINYFLKAESVILERDCWYLIDIWNKHSYIPPLMLLQNRHLLNSWKCIVKAMTLWYISWRVTSVPLTLSRLG